MATGFFYNVPSSMLMFMFIFILVIVAIIGLCLFNAIVSQNFAKTFNDANTALYLSTGAVALSVVLAFIVSSEWQNYSEIQNDLEQEANVLYTLHKIVRNMTNTEPIQCNIIKYICSIINDEFPSMREGKLPVTKEHIFDLEITLLSYEPRTEKDLILYDKAITLLNNALRLRDERLRDSTVGIPKELWWVIIFIYVIIIVMMWFISGDLRYRIIMTSLVTAVYASLLFLAITLDYPFRGDFSLGAESFQKILDQLSITCPYECP